jgi:hypothetical protein
MEADLIVHFPKHGNQGKYLGYTVVAVDRKQGTVPQGKQVKLGDILEAHAFEEGYPHTVGYFKSSSGEGAEFKAEYLEIRRISSVEEFWLFLNALDI